MNTIDWNLERAADELYWAKIIAHRNRHNPFLHDSEEMEECRYMAGMHIASANALADKRVQIRPDDAIVKAEGGAA